MVFSTTVKNHLHGRYRKFGKNFYFTSRMVAKNLNQSPYKLRHILLKLEEDGIIERTNNGDAIRWRTCFGKKN